MVLLKILKLHKIDSLYVCKGLIRLITFTEIQVKGLKTRHLNLTVKLQNLLVSTKIPILQIPHLCLPQLEQEPD